MQESNLILERRMLLETDKTDKMDTNELFISEPDIEDASHSQLRGKGFSFRGREEDDTHYIVHDGQKFYEDEIEYAKHNDTGEIPRVEDGKLIIAHPMWTE